MFRELSAVESEWPVGRVISDIEIPEMDGYTLTTETRKSAPMRNRHTLLHTSLNGARSSGRAKKSDAKYVLAKFASDELAEAVRCALC